MRLNFSIIIILFFSVFNAFADFVDCKEEYLLVNGVRITRMWFEQSQSCYLNIGNDDKKDLIYRDFMFTNDGMLMVFNSFGEGPDSTMTGAREFYFFPRKKMPEFTVNADNTISIIMANSDKINFASPLFRIHSVENGTFTESKQIVASNRGGVEITSYRGLMLDVGFKKGNSPSIIPMNSSTFRDSNGIICKVKNKEIFDYNAGDSDLKYTDEGLKKFLSERCPKLEVNF